MREVTSIILAAGSSRRMGEQNKLLLPINGVPMIRHMVEIYGEATNHPVFVVTGYQAKEVEGALAGSGAQVVFNADFAQGQSTSVACGLRAADEANKVLIGLGDQPLLTADDISTLLAAHASGDSLRISVAALNQRRGNPIVVPAYLRARLLKDPRSPGCQKFTRSHPEYVQFHQLASPGFYTDVDTPKAYASLNKSISEEIT